MYVYWFISSIIDFSLDNHPNKTYIVLPNPKLMTRIESPSSINTYNQCARKYYYSYIERLPTKDNIHTVRGKIVHSALEKFFKINPENLPENDYENVLRAVLADIFNKEWRSEYEKLVRVLDRSPLMVHHYYTDTIKMINNWIEMFIDKIKSIDKPAKDAFKELIPITEHKLVSEEFRVMGFVDAIHENNEITLIDYKTSNKSDITDEYKLQLAIYSLLYKTSKNKLPDKVGISFLGNGKEIFLDVNDELIKLAEDETKKIHEKTITQEKDDYKKSPGPLCKYSSGQCDFYETCKPFD